MQTKNVLTEFFNEILIHLKDSGALSLKFEVTLPPTKANSNEDGNLTPPSPKMQVMSALTQVNSNSSIEIDARNKYIPESIIAQKLRDLLATLVKQQREKEREICEAIIDAFEALYSKYIDSNGAIYMINISSQNRSNLMKLFDTSYCTRQRHIQTGSRSIGFVQNNDKSMDNESQNMTLIKQELNRLDKNNINAKNGSLEWLLGQIIGNFESAAVETAVLLRQAFFRFKRDKYDLYQDLCNLVVNDKCLDLG